jgi:hypothetical protein
MSRTRVTSTGPRRRTAVRSLLLATAVLFAVCVPSAAAAPPPNDTPGTATLLSTLPFEESVSIAEAGTEPLDAELYDVCGGDVLEHTVWYRYDATTEGIVQLTATTRSKWQPGVLVTEGFPDGDALTGCGNDDTYIEVEPGQSYYFAAYSRTAGATGTMRVLAEFIPKSVFLTMDSVTRDRATGSLSASGTITCSGKKVFGFIDLAVISGTRRFVVGTINLPACNGTAVPWAIESDPDAGSFKGRLTVEAFAFVCSRVCEGEATPTVTLK